MESLYASLKKKPDIELKMFVLAFRFQMSLNAAVIRGRGRFVHFLLEKGWYDPAEIEELFVYATIDGRLDIMKMLFVRRMYIDLEAAACNAATMGYAHVLEWIVSMGGNVHCLSEKPLRDAAERGYLDAVKFLVLDGADVSILEHQATISAAENNQIEVVKFLLSVGGRLDDNDLDAFETVYENGYWEITRLFITSLGVGRMLIESAKRDYVEVVAQAMEYPVLKEVVRLAIYHAAMNGSIKVLRRLVEQFEDVDHYMEEVILCGNYRIGEVVRLWISWNPPVKRLQEILLTAAARGSAEIIHLMYIRGLNLCWDEALWIACSRSFSKEIAEFLLDSCEASIGTVIVRACRENCVRAMIFCLHLNPELVDHFAALYEVAENYNSVEVMKWIKMYKKYPRH